MKFYRIYCSLILTLVLTMIMAGGAFAGDTTTSTVTVTVNAINEISVSGGPITLTINSATAGQDPDAEQDATMTMAWTSNEADKKITVESDQAAPNFTLKILATGVAGGTAAAEATLSDNSAKDLVTGIATTVGSCGLRFTASATAAQGTGSVVHTLTYTLTDSP